jgi:predicted O-methyltransferase YrrM
VSEPAEYRFGNRSVNSFDLYEIAVQCPPIEAAFLDAVHAGNPRVLGEDFAGPAGVSRAWLAMGDDRRAIATDLDDEPLRHAVRRLVEKQGEGAVERLTIRERDALEVGDRADVIASLNFAVCELHRRDRLLTYLRNCLFRLEAGGVLVCDLYGGVDAMLPGTSEQVIETEQGELVYTWEQVEADATTSRVRNAIHFELPDGTTIDRAFGYDWRLWSPAELRDAMREAGFRTTEVYAHYGEAMDEDGNLLVEPISTDEESGEIAPDLDDQWVLYIVGRV